MTAVGMISAEEAVRHIKTGDTVMVGGFGLVGAPLTLIDALADHSDATDLTVVSNNIGEPGKGLGKLLRQGRIRRGISSFFTSNPEAVAAVNAGAIEATLVPQGTFAEAIRAGGAGIGGFFTPVAAGTLLAEGKEERIIDGVPHVLERRRLGLGHRLRQSQHSVLARRRRPRARMRRHRGLRRLPRRVPAEHPCGRARGVFARLPIRLARNPRRGGAVERRARVLPSREGLRPAEPSLRGAQSSLHPVSSRRGPDGMAGRADLGGAPAPPRARRVDARRGTGAGEGVTGMRSYVAEPMRYGRLFLAGDAAHIVPPTGAKGLNLALRDVRLLAEALVSWFGTGRTELFDAYSSACLRRVWRAEHFSWWMTSMLHRLESDDDFGLKLQLSQLRYVTTSNAAATSLAENYVGLERV